MNTKTSISKETGFKCPKCGFKTLSWCEECNCLTEFTIQHDGAIEEKDRDYVGDTTFYCPECGDEWHIPFDEICEGVRKNTIDEEKNETHKESSGGTDKTDCVDA